MIYNGGMIGPHNDGTYLEQSLGVQVLNSINDFNKFPMFLGVSLSSFTGD
jgi:hypothetical protein